MPCSSFDAHCDTISSGVTCTAAPLRRHAGHLDLERRPGKGRWGPVLRQPSALPEDTPGGGPCGRPSWTEYALFRSELDANADPDRLLPHAGPQAQGALAAGKAAGLPLGGGRRAAGLRPGQAPPGPPDGGAGGEHHLEPPQRRSRAPNAAGAGPRPCPTGAGPSSGTMGALGMLVDVSHLSDPGFWDVMEVIRPARWWPHIPMPGPYFLDPRNLTDEQFTAIIRHQWGGRPQHVRRLPGRGLPTWIPSPPTWSTSSPWAGRTT